MPRRRADLLADFLPVVLVAGSIAAAAAYSWWQAKQDRANQANAASAVAAVNQQLRMMRPPRWGG